MKTMTIERLLNWAFTEELCKISSAQAAAKLGSVGSAWSKVSQFGELGTLVDLSPNRFGVIPDLSSDAMPHPDALITGEAVRDLSEMKFDLPDAWQPFPDWDDPRGTVAEAVALVLDDIRAKSDVLQGRHVVSLVTTAAVLRRGPDWEAEKPPEQVKKVGRRELWFLRVRQKDSFGKMITIEVDGYDAKSKRPKPGAFQKYELEWSIRGLVMDRLDWQLWQDALAVLHRRLKDNRNRCSTPTLPFAV